MRRHWRSRLFALLGIAAIVAGIYWMWLPEPQRVETAIATRGPLQVTVDDDGEVRMHDLFTVAAPVAGRLARITLDDGDRVQTGSVIARIYPTPLDPKEREEAEARLRAARALHREALQLVERAQADHDLQVRERRRAEHLSASGDISRQVLETRIAAEAMTARQVEAARFRAEAAQYDVETAQAALVPLQSPGPSSTVTVRSPVSGRVLRVLEKSERVVTAGTPLVSIGDASRLEVVIDVLSSEAVKIPVGARVLLDGWGGEEALPARVRLVEPYAFTKVSALGIDEQRVNVIADFLQPPEKLGDGYRVEARIVLWESDYVLQIPVSALFRCNGQQAWCVFVVADGRAKRRLVETGHRGGLAMEICSGLQSGDRVIVHPSNQLTDDALVAVAATP